MQQAEMADSTAAPVASGGNFENFSTPVFIVGGPEIGSTLASMLSPKSDGELIAETQARLGVLQTVIRLCAAAGPDATESHEAMSHFDYALADILSLMDRPIRSAA